MCGDNNCYCCGYTFICVLYVLCVVKRYGTVCGRCVEEYETVAGVFRAHACLCVSADMFANSINTAGRLHAGCLIVCLPWRTFYQTFVCKQISIKLSALCNHIAYSCVSVFVW